VLHWPRITNCYVGFAHRTTSPTAVVSVLRGLTLIVGMQPRQTVSALQLQAPRLYNLGHVNDYFDVVYVLTLLHFDKIAWR
jgi:hypothetical protein